MLNSFVKRCHFFLDNSSINLAIKNINRMLAEMLMEPEFVALIPDSPREVIYEAPGGLTILGHTAKDDTWSHPHDHGSAWAIYGVAEGVSTMEDYQPIGGKLARLTNRYQLVPGQAGFYKIGDVHTHHTHGPSKLIRIEGRNIWRWNVGGNWYVKA